MAVLKNPCGESSASNIIQVQESFLPEAPEIGPLLSAPLCFGASVQLQVLNDLGPGFMINWSNGETGSSIIVSSSGAYTATANNTANICGDGPVSNVIIVTIDPPFLPVVQNNLCHLTAPMGSGYQWFLDGVEIVGANGPTWSAMVAGNYSVSMVDEAGCAGISDPVFSEACLSNVQDVNGLVSARVYPNPTLDRVFLDINLPNASNVQLDLFAADGRLVEHLFLGELWSGRQTLNIALPALPAGIYQYRLKTELGNVNGNLVIQHP